MPLELSPEALTGWGRTVPSVARVGRPTTLEEAVALLGESNGRGAIARGLGRSYGDLAQNGGGIVLDMTGLGEVTSFDAATGLVTAQGGCSLAHVIDTCSPAGWFPPVTPGTRFVTVGGAIACDVHGKNHHVDGAFGRHVRSLVLLTPDGALHRLDPESTPEAFWATVGGLGLTGVIVEASFQLLRMPSPAIREQIERTRDLDQTLDRLAETDGDHRYSVAWLDVSSPGKRLGRGVLMQGDHADAGAKARLPKTSPLVTAPRWATIGTVLRGRGMKVLNELYFRRAPQRAERVVDLASFFYPLDAIGEWNRVYGTRGFIQYQFAVPLERDDLIRAAVERLTRAGVPSTLAVLKRFGESSPAPLSFPLPGWTLALDLALPAAGAAGILDDLDEEIAEAGGRVYLAKDARLRPELMADMYPRLEEWLDLRRRLDPTGVMQNDLARRLEIGAGR